VLLVALPALIGLTLGTVLNQAEQRGRLAWWHHLLGATDVRDAWDYAFQRMERETFLIVRTDKELVAGRYTTGHGPAELLPHTTSFSKRCGCSSTTSSWSRWNRHTGLDPGGQHPGRLHLPAP
jgi:hypothetical protein